MIILGYASKKKKKKSKKKFDIWTINIHIEIGLRCTPINGQRSNYFRSIPEEVQTFTILIQVG